MKVYRIGVRKQYHSGELVRINYLPYYSKKNYIKGDLVNYETLLYHSLSNFNQRKSSTDYPEYWEWLNFEYFAATNLPNNTNKNPLSVFTMRNSDKTKKYWQPIHLNESALEIPSANEDDTIGNIKFFNLTIRISINNPLIKIDKIKTPLKPLKIEFYASHVYIITEPYINAFNRNLEYVKLYEGNLTVPNHFILIHVYNSYGLKFIRGNFQLGKIIKAKTFQYGKRSNKIIDLYEETSKSVSESCGKLYRP